MEVESQTSDLSFSCVTEQTVAKCSICKDFTIMPSIKAPFYEEESRAAIDLVTVIDRSGSMGGEKIKLVKETLNFVVRQLKSSDKLSIVLYDHEIEEKLPLTIMDRNGKVISEREIKEITSRGSTDLCAGLLKGLSIILQRESKNDVASVLLFTDGLANSGIQNTDAIVTEMGKLALASDDPAKDPTLPCTVYTFGFGTDQDANMLKAIADKGKGVYAFISNKDTIADAFADCLGGLLSVVAQNITLEIRAMNGVIINKVRTVYKVTCENDVYTIHVGDIQSEEEKDILLSVDLPEAPMNIFEALQLKLCYFNVINSKHEEKVLFCNIPRDDNTVGTVDFKVDCQKNRIITAEALEEAKKRGDSHDIQGAKKILQDSIQKITNSISGNDPFVLTLIKDLQDSINGLRDEQTYQTYGGYTMSSYSSAHHQQRATYSTTSYTTNARSAMRFKSNNNDDF